MIALGVVVVVGIVVVVGVVFVVVVGIAVVVFVGDNNSKSFNTSELKIADAT